MHRKIVGFHQDQVGDWVADLECGHTRHVRHNPPLAHREWVLSAEERQRFIGTPLNCSICDELSNEEDAIEDYLNQQKKMRIAEAMKAACLKAALEAYEDAKIRGLCEEGAWDVAIDALKSVDVKEVLKSLPD